MANVTLVNPNLIQAPAVAPYALDILATALSEKGHDIEILDLTPRAQDWEKEVDKHFNRNSPDFVGITLRNAWDLYFPSFCSLPEQGSFLPSHKRIVDRISTHFPRERIIVGGTGFSSMPQTMLKRLNLRYGVIGAGETIFCNIIEKLNSGMEISNLPLVFEVDKGYRKDIIRRLNIPIRRDFVDNHWYYQNGEHVGLRTTNGCTQHCTFCFESEGKGHPFSNSLENILLELDQLVRIGIMDVHLNDSEMNVSPSSLEFSKSVARAIIGRGYLKDLRFWSYMQPAPFDEEYAQLWKRAGMRGILFGTDHTDSDILKSMRKWYGQMEIVDATKICRDLDIAVMHELLFGMYGETMDSMKRAIDFIWRLEPHVIGTTLGVGIVPTCSLARDRRVISAVENSSESYRIERYGIYCKDIPLEDPTYLIDPSIKIPQAYEELKNFVGERINKIMVPTLDSTSASNNQLVNSERITNMRKKGQKGAHWFWYPTQFEE